MTVREILSRLDPVRPIKGGWQARCPAHDDKIPSLSVSEREGKILLKCFAGCEPAAIVAALNLRMADLFVDGKPTGNGPGEKPEAVYPYSDENGDLLFEVVRFPGKQFRQRRPDGKGGWLWNLDGTRRVLFNLPAVLKAQSVLILEGEKDCLTAAKLGLTATCNPGGAGKWRADYSESLRGKRVAVICDADAPGQAHGRDVARHLVGVTSSAKLIEALPGDGVKDLSAFAGKIPDVAACKKALLALIKDAAELTADDVANWAKPSAKPESPWAAAEGMETFLAPGGDGANFLDCEKRVLARASITELFSPRGLGKSLYALWLAVTLAKRGLRVLVLDRDNPRHVVRSRLVSFGVDSALPGLKVLSREKCPPLTNAPAWAQFPYSDYDVVILDSLDSSAEGVGEQDSAKPSRAIAPLLDIARRENGPAVLVLGNTVRAGLHSRGSGVIEDRADIVFEVRDATDFHPTGGLKVWFEELPPADAASWANRSKRRKGREIFRLAFVPTKFRIGQEPEPFVLEINLASEPWSVRDATNEVDREGVAVREQRAREHAEKIASAKAALETEILRRASAGEPPMLKDRDAIPFLTAKPYGLKRTDARDVVNTPDGRWIVSRIAGRKGHPIGLLPPEKNGNDGGNAPTLEAAKALGENDADFRRPHETSTAEIDPTQTRMNSGSAEPRISAGSTNFSPGEDVEVL
jgi:AAA domain